MLGQLNLSRDEDPECVSQSFFELFEAQDMTLSAMEMPGRGVVHQVPTVEEREYLRVAILLKSMRVIQLVKRSHRA